LKKRSIISARDATRTAIFCDKRDCARFLELLSESARLFRSQDKTSPFYWNIWAIQSKCMCAIVSNEAPKHRFLETNLKNLKNIDTCPAYQLRGPGRGTSRF
jgi:hypothetical protein